MRFNLITITAFWVLIMVSIVQSAPAGFRKNMNELIGKKIEKYDVKTDDHRKAATTADKTYKIQKDFFNSVKYPNGKKPWFPYPDQYKIMKKNQFTASRHKVAAGLTNAASNTLRLFTGRPLRPPPPKPKKSGQAVANGSGQASAHASVQGSAHGSSQETSHGSAQVPQIR